MTKPTNCACCRRSDTEEYPDSARSIFLCEFCASTYAGIAYRDSTAYGPSELFTATLIAQLYWKLRQDLTKQTE